MTKIRESTKENLVLFFGGLIGVFLMSLYTINLIELDLFIAMGFPSLFLTKIIYSKFCPDESW